MISLTQDLHLRMVASLRSCVVEYFDLNKSSLQLLQVGILVLVLITVVIDY